MEIELVSLLWQYDYLQTSQNIERAYCACIFTYEDFVNGLIMMIAIIIFSGYFSQIPAMGAIRSKVQVSMM